MSGEYSIAYSKAFYGDLEEIHNYIAQILKAPGSADKIVQRIYSISGSLSFMPERFALVSWSSNTESGIRRAPCGDYGIYYVVAKEKRLVYVLQVIRKGRDAAKLLRV